MRLAFLTDIHLDPDYSENCGFVMCYDKGFYEKDSPQALLDIVLEDMYFNYHDFQENVNSTNKLDAIIVTGDTVVHDLS